MTPANISDYTLLGFRVLPSHPARAKCLAAKHREEEVDLSPVPNRQTEVLCICHECKHYFYFDASDSW
jgi:hypothetical protein